MFKPGAGGASHDKKGATMKPILILISLMFLLAVTSNAEEVTYRKQIQPYLGASEEERQKNLNVFKEWVGHWTLKRWKEIAKEELDRIRVKY